MELAAAEKRAKMLIASSMENANSEQSIADRAKELQMKEEMEALVRKEAEMTEKLKILEERRAVQDAEAIKVVQFKRAVMVALSKVDPDQVEAEEARQKEGLVEGVELLSVMHDYIEGQGSEYEEVHHHHHHHHHHYHNHHHRLSLLLLCFCLGLDNIEVTIPKPCFLNPQPQTLGVAVRRAGLHHCEVSIFGHCTVED